ncbi:MAG TPA: hypothetical protein VIM67_02900 [Terriglobus sp.]
MARCQGKFIFPLDDVYIHLALAEKLAHGHYGINLGEYASPSSSPLWSFLITPFAGTRFHIYVPLVLDTIFGIMSAGLIGTLVSRLTSTSNERARIPVWQQLLLCLLLILAADLPSLTVMAMEHGLQVLLTICCAFGFVETMRGRPIPGWVIAAAIVAPVVRYEDLSITLAMSLLLFALGQRLKAALTFGASLVPLAVFSVFLHTLGLPPLPTSVLQKSETALDHSPLASLLSVVKNNLHAVLHDPLHHGPVLLLFFTCLWLTIKSRTLLQRAVFLGPTLVCTLQILLGRFGWLHRYEVYATIFATMIVTAWALQTIASTETNSIAFPRLAAPNPMMAGLFLFLLLCGGISIKATGETPFCSQAIYRQQYQLGRFLTQFYNGNVMLNDLGAMSFQRRPGTYVFDLAGLGSLEAQQQRHMDAPWIQAMADKHSIDLAIVYKNMWPLPATWTYLGSVCERKRGFVVLTSRCVALYSIRSDKDALIRHDLDAFVHTLPPGVWYQQ